LASGDLVFTLAKKHNNLLPNFFIDKKNFFWKNTIGSVFPKNPFL